MGLHYRGHYMTSYPVAVLCDKELWLHLAAHSQQLHYVLVVQLTEHVHLMSELKVMMFITRQ